MRRHHNVSDASSSSSELVQETYPLTSFAENESNGSCCDANGEVLGNDIESPFSLSLQHEEEISRHRAEIRRLQEVVRLLERQRQGGVDGREMGDMGNVDGTAISHDRRCGSHCPPPPSTPTHMTDSLDIFWHRVCWLVGLLLLQSTSSFILKRFDALIQQHPVVVYFLTMLVGAGGNTGGQSAVLVIRGIAVGKIPTDKGLWRFLLSQLWTGVQLATCLFLASFIRVFLFDITLIESMAICTSMFVIVLTSALLGTLLPLVLRACGVDPAHASACIQVLMDILGVGLTCLVSYVWLNQLAPFLESSSGGGGDDVVNSNTSEMSAVDNDRRTILIRHKMLTQ
ncbi:unnamed protein product [Vitrella brassicaformis CCMP3155]|uniref:SLC41A/MgtE integral membrane domain-containing protein n=1 Tax=Vitrella brassicaformis (strain CCMP3155) TaxID=1169540 RepID=A0A0G4EGU1_VITBC|nr:unnamed protein product [Vitrella brassicaformis CCMP3155]|eukprot:CEL94693.1 unnamed protein product [Vitrella brassicaformis CCMP3155]